jgi:hypothetical protein
MNLKPLDRELAHRALKVFYLLTNKLDTPAQLAKHERRRRALRRVPEAGGISLSISQPPVDPPPPDSVTISRQLRTIRLLYSRSFEDTMMIQLSK